MRILIPVFSPPTGAMGPHTRALAIGIQAMAQGHEIAFCASGNVFRRLQEQQYTVFQTPEPTLFGLPQWFSKRLVRQIRAFTPSRKPGTSFGSIWLVLLAMGMSNPRFLTALVNAELEAVSQFGPDMIFTELDPAAYLVSEIAGIPLSTTYATVAREGIDSYAYGRITRTVNTILRTHGKSPKELADLCFGTHILKIIPSIPELDGTNPQRSDVCYVGSLLSETRRSQKLSVRLKPGKRAVYLYLGTGSLSFQKVKRLLPQVFTNNSSYHCIAASEIVTQEKSVEGVTFVPYVSAHHLLPHCAWTICHGGHNTIVQSLLHHVPLLVFPGAVFERRFNARKVQLSRCGFMGETSDFTRDWFEHKLSLHPQVEPPARVLGKKLNACGGARTAVQAIERFVHAGKGFHSSLDVGEN